MTIKDEDLLPLPRQAAYGIVGATGFDPDDGHKQLIGVSVAPCGSAMKEREVRLFTEDQFRQSQREAMEKGYAMAKAENDALRIAASKLLAYRVGELPARGWLPDTDAVREILHELASALKTAPEQSGNGNLA